MESLKTKLPDLSEASDTDLVGLTLEGHGAAFGTIMQRYNRRLYRVARGILRDSAEAEDVLQEAYVRAYATFPSFRGEAGLGTWLTRIVMNEALGRRRQRRPTEELATLDLAKSREDTHVIMFPGVAAPVDPETAAARAEVRRLLERAVDDLPDVFRVVFLMRDIEGMSIEETAANLGIRPETVKTRLHRARRLMRNSLQAKLATALCDAFPFEGARCARVTQSVLKRLGIENAAGEHDSPGMPTSPKSG